MTACTCCHGAAWTLPGEHPCGLEHPVVDFDGLLLLECHCAVDPPAQPLRTPCQSLDEAHELLQPLADHVLTHKLDELGIHHGELRQQRGQDRLERITRTGHYRPTPVEHRRAA